MLWFLNEDFLVFYEFGTFILLTVDTFLVNLQFHIPGHKVPDLKVKICQKGGMDQSYILSFLSESELQLVDYEHMFLM